MAGLHHLRDVDPGGNRQASVADLGVGQRRGGATDGQAEHDAFGNVEPPDQGRGLEEVGRERRIDLARPSEIVAVSDRVPGRIGAHPDDGLRWHPHGTIGDQVTYLRNKMAGGRFLGRPSPGHRDQLRSWAGSPQPEIQVRRQIPDVCLRRGVVAAAERHDPLELLGEPALLTNGLHAPSDDVRVGSRSRINGKCDSHGSGQALVLSETVIMRGCLPPRPVQ